MQHNMYGVCLALLGRSNPSDSDDTGGAGIYGNMGNMVIFPIQTHIGQYVRIIVQLNNAIGCRTVAAHIDPYNLTAHIRVDPDRIRLGCRHLADRQHANNQQ